MDNRRRRSEWKGSRVHGGGWVALWLMLLLLVAAGCSSSSKQESAPQSAFTSAGNAPSAAADQSGSRSSSTASNTTGVQSTSSALNNADTKAKQEAGKAAGASAPTSSAYGLALADSAGAFDRKILYKANIVMEVGHYGDAVSDIKNKALLAGGYIVQFSENRTTYEQSGTLTVKVPSNGFTGFIAALEQMKPKTIQQSIQGQDVTEEFVDLTSRLKAKQVVESRLLDFLGKSAKTEELISFSNELGKVQEEIEKIKGRMTYLEQNVAFSTVEIRIYQKLEAAKKAEDKQTDSFGTQLKHTASKSAAVMMDVLQALMLFIAGALPVLLVLAIVGTPFILWIRKRRGIAIKQQQRALQLRQENRSAAPPVDDSSSD